MTVIRFDPAIDLEVCEAMCREFEEYLVSNVLYGQMNPVQANRRAWPKLTIGGALERLCRLNIGRDHLTAEQRARLDRVQQTFETIRTTHLARYRTKAMRELQSRLDAWEWFLDDYVQRPSEMAAYYPNEVRARLKIALLVETLQGEAGLDAKIQRLQWLDERLRADFLPGEFVWDATLSPAFPSEPYWWLYGGLKETREEPPAPS